MDRALATAYVPEEKPFRDGLGERRAFNEPARGESLELLQIRSELATVPSFEFALRERVSRLSSFRHAYFGAVRGVERLTTPSVGLAIVSEHTQGVRLSDLLAQVGPRQLDFNAALCLIRQLVPAAATLHEHARDVAHGAIAPERLVVTPNARIVLVEYVLGAALEQLRFSHERYWTELRVPLPPSAGAPRFDQRADIMQVGIVALSLLLGRLLRDDECPQRLGDLIASLADRATQEGFEALLPGLTSWLRRALQLESRSSFASAVDARIELDRALAESGYLVSTASLERFLEVYHTDTDTPAIPQARAIEAPAPGPRPVHQTIPPTPVELPDQTSAIEPFADETEPVAFHEPETLGNLPVLRSAWVLAGVVVALLGVASAWMFLRGGRASSAAPAPSRLVVTTNPAGAQALVDGQVRGVTPLTIQLTAGSHVVELRGNGGSRFLPITLTAGGELAQYVDMPSAPPPAAALPAAKSELPKDDAAAAAPAPGYIAISTPIELRIFEHQRLIGTSAVARLMLTAGRHELELTNDDLGFKTTRVVQVTAGKVGAITVAMPNGTLALNAQPWADVWIDGNPSGQTPIGNLAVAIGSHDIVLRHPDLGERHYTLTVGLKEPTRLSVDLRQK